MRKCLVDISNINPSVDNSAFSTTGNQKKEGDCSVNGNAGFFATAAINSKLAGGSNLKIA